MDETITHKRLLVLVRHGESEWNALHRWTGWTDVGLTPRGCDEAKLAAQAVKDIPFHHAFTSMLLRAQKTLDIMLEELNLTTIPVEKHHALDERNYGIYTGKNKLEIKTAVGEEEFTMIRRGWDHPIPEGENLKQVYERAIPYFESTILPLLKKGENVLVSSHGNTLRAFIKYLDHVSDDEIANVEMGTGQVIVYTLDGEGKVIDKQIRGNASKRMQ